MSYSNKRLIGLLIAVAPAMYACRFVSSLQAKHLLNEGVRAFTEQKYDKAAAFFQDSIRLDPGSEDARMYLAVTYSSQFVPGSSDPRNLGNAEKAIAVFKDLIDSSKGNGKPNIKAMLSIAIIYYHLKKYDELKRWCAKIRQVDPGNGDLRGLCDSF